MDATSRETMWAPNREDAHRGAHRDRWPTGGAHLGPNRPPTAPCLSKTRRLRMKYQNKWRGRRRRHMRTVRGTLTPRCPPPWGSSSSPQTWRRPERSQTPDRLPARRRCGSWSARGRRWGFICFLLCREVWRVEVVLKVCFCGNQRETDSGYRPKTNPEFRP